MRKKLLFLAVALAMCGTPLLTSCSKDDEPKQTVQNVSVANTIWRADNGTTFKFYADGTCELGIGLYDYKQIGNEVNIVGHLIWYGKELWYTRYAYVKGNVLEVEMRDNIGDPFIIVKFHKVG